MKHMTIALFFMPMLFSWHIPAGQPANEKPDEYRFRKVVLSKNVADPTDMAILPNGDIIITELSGAVKLFKAKSKKVVKTNHIAVDNAPESGLLAIVPDPAFASNKYVYIIYSPRKRKENFVSRFVWSRDSLNMTSEKIIIRIPDERACCHAGSGLVFDSKGNLYITTGDNTNPFGTNYAPLDERPGKTNFDAQRTSANTKDLRGKVLRIHPETDGTYSIPQGNLFTDTSIGRPEIFAMGCRNPYKITVDPTTDIPYWGEVGPDASDYHAHGPRGYDEINQGLSAGNYGWPFFIGNNEAYNEVDFITNQTGERFDPLAPVNASVNNTGHRTLPSIKPPIIYYPYDKSEQFPSLGSGGRTAIAGPFYKLDQNAASSIAFSSYFDHAFFIADWMRNWIKVVRINSENKLDSIEDFMPSTTFQKPISMKFGPDGALYVLEFGSLWGGNKDSRLVRVEYIRGNRAPIAKVSVDKTSGSLPLSVELSASGSFDRDANDRLKYEWIVEGSRKSTDSPALVHTFTRPGTFKVKCRVIDAGGLVDSSSVTIRAGNSMPEVTINTDDEMFYDDAINYKIQVRDAEDVKIDEKRALVTVQYFPEGVFQEQSSAKILNPYHRGATWINENDCKACHAFSAKSVGPSFNAISTRYYSKRTDKKFVSSLASKVITGGKGSWGDVAMNPHPQLSKEAATEIVNYILSLRAPKPQIKKLATEGVISTRTTQQAGGAYVLSAAYTDNGTKSTGPLTTRVSKVLRSPTISAKEFTDLYEMRRTEILTSINKGGYAKLNQINLSGISSIAFRVTTETQGSSIEVRLGDPDGPLLATLDIPVGKWSEWQTLKTTIPKTEGLHDIYFVFRNRLYVLNLLNLESVSFEK
jgi:cytochrome c